MHIRPAKTLSAEQAAGCDQILEFRRSPDQVLTIGGLAGVGKSTLLADVAGRLPEAHVCAPTGKAAHVLRQKMHRDAGTIHSLFYQLTGKGIDEKTGRRRLWFAKIHVPGALRGELVLIDEASMIDRWMMNDLIASGAKIVLFGDTGQLPPVYGTQYFNHPDITLRQIHRQALDSAIIRQAHAVRTTGRYEADGPDFQIGRRPDDEDYLCADTVITWKRKTRQQVNAFKRRLLGFRGAYPQTGETVLCLRNAPMFGIYNGGTYRTLAPFDDRTGTMVVEVDGKEIVIPDAAFTIGDDPSDDEDKSTTFSFGYALTCHKAQGSEFDNVLVISEYPSWPERRRWLYTALTRAAQSILVVSEP